MLQGWKTKVFPCCSFLGPNPSLELDRGMFLKVGTAEPRDLVQKGQVKGLTLPGYGGGNW